MEAKEKEREEEPSFREFFKTVGDTIASNRLSVIMRQKFQAQSYYEFFNRIGATGLLLYISGVLGLLSFLLFRNINFSILDIGNSIFIAIGAAIIFIILELMGAVNDAESPIHRSEFPAVGTEITKIFLGIFVLGALLYQLFWRAASPYENLVLALAAIAFTGTWLIGVAWLFGGFSGLKRLRDSDE